MPKTTIEWTDKTWNPVRGCSRVSAGCMNCYAEKVAFRFKGDGMPYEGLLAKGGQWNGTIKFVDQMLDKPLSWKSPCKVFVNSMSDLFHENLSDRLIDRIFAVMALANHHTFQILTKRPERMKEYISNFSFERMLENCMDVEGYSQIPRYSMHHLQHCFGQFPNSTLYPETMPRRNVWPLPNVWLGISVENQETANTRIPLLLQTPAAVRWISAEPLLGSINLDSTLGGIQWIGGHRGCSGTHHGIGTPDCPKHSHHHHDVRCKPGINWVVAGGESGSGARPMHPDWVRSLRDQCAAAGVPFLFKQWGEWSQYVNEAHFTHGDEEKQPHAWVDSETAEFGWCWPIDSDGVWSNHIGNPRQRAPDSDYLHDAVAIMGKHGKKAAGRMLDEVLHDDYPDVKEPSHA